MANRILAATTVMGLATAMTLMSPVQAGEKTYDVAPFHQISASGAGELQIKVGESQSVSVVAKDRYLDKMEVEVEDGRLKLRLKSRGSWFGSSPSYKAVITVPKLDYLGLSGASEATATGIDAEDFEYRASGASETDLSGSCQSLTVRVSGASELNAKDFVCVDATVKGSGASELEIHATGDLEVSASGATDIDVYGSPKTRSMSTSGASDIDYKDS